MFVNNLAETIECPNCESRGLITSTCVDGTQFKQCTVCAEYIYEDDRAICEPIEVVYSPDDIDDSLMEIEYAVSDLTRYATTQHELDQMERIRNIFDELISVIRRMK